MENKEIVRRLTNVHNMLDELSQAIEAIDIALFDLALQFADEDDFPDTNVEEMKETMSLIKKMFKDDECAVGKVEDVVDFLERCLDGHEDINVGDKAMIIDSAGVHSDEPAWVFRNIKDRELVMKYAYGVKPEAKSGLLKVVGKDDDGKCIYLLDEEKDECYIVERDYVARYIPKDEILEAIKAG